MDIHKRELALDLPGMTGARIAARCFAPDPALARQLPIALWVFAIPGSGADWRYFHLEPPGGDESYSWASHLTARGVGLVAIDNLGVGGSTFPADGSLLTLELLAKATHQAAFEVRERLRRGSLLPEVEALPELWLCGVGHSGGGGVAIVQQGAHRSFDLLAVLGMAADDVEIHGGHDGVRAEFETTERGMLHRHEMTAASRARGFLDDVPRDIVDARELLPFPPSFPSMMKPGTLLPYARQVVCPVFVGMGEVDYVGSPFEEPRRYARSTDVTVYIQPGSAHWHFYSSRRQELWTALYNWMWSRARFRDGRRPDTAPRRAALSR